MPALSLQAGATVSVNPSLLLAGNQAVLTWSRLSAQISLMKAGVSINEPFLVYENGVIISGHHRAAAAINLGQPVTVQVIPGNGISVTNLPVANLPIVGGPQ